MNAAMDAFATDRIPDSVPCPACGEPAVPGAGACEACDAAARLDYELFSRSDSLDEFESGWAAYLETRDGRLAERAARRARRPE